MRSGLYSALVFLTVCLFSGIVACGDGGGGICPDTLDKFMVCLGPPPASFDEEEFLDDCEAGIADISSNERDAIEECLALSCPEFFECIDTL